MIQIAQLLDERSMSFSFCLNKADLVLICGMTLLYQGIDLKQDSKMLKDNERLVNAVIKIMESMKSPITYEFKRIAGMLVSLDEPITSLPTPPRQSPDTSMAAPPAQRTSPTPRSKKKSSHGHQSQQYPLGRHSGASMSENDLLSQQEKLRRMTMPNITPVTDMGRPNLHRSASRTSFDSARPNPASIMQRRDHRLSTSQAAMVARVSSGQKTNLDFLALGNPSSHTGSSSPAQSRHHVPTSGPSTQHQYASAQAPPKSAAGGVSPSEWEALLGQIDGGQINLYDAIYGGPQVSLDTPVTSAVEGSWSPDSLDLSTFNLGDFGATQHGGSLSEESLSSASGGDDLSSLDFRDFQGNHGTMMAGGGDEGFMMEAMPVGGNFGL
jgi:hypothetical protein